MEPRIQYAKTSDGVNIAFSTIGEGRPLVVMPYLPIASMHMTWALPELRRIIDMYAATRLIVRYDGRGFGLSDRGEQVFTVDTLINDLEAVAGQSGLERFDLMAVFTTGPAAITFTARNPGRVDRLVLFSSFADGARFTASPQFKAFYAMRTTDWRSYVQVMARQVSTDPEAPALLAEATAETTFAAFMDSLSGFDATASMASVRSKTLVVAARRGAMSNLSDEARTLAAGIPGARLVLVEGDRSFEAINDFLLEDEAVEPTPQAIESPAGTAVILFADIVDSTVLTERLGDSAFREKARDLDGALRAIIRGNAGTPIEGKLLGDGVLATFASASQAIAAALACGKAGDEGGLPLHLGLHAGDVIREDNNVFGGAVNVAARISGLSAPGEVLVSDTVRSLARTSAGVRFEDRGEQALKGVGEAVRVWAVREGAE